MRCNYDSIEIVIFHRYYIHCTKKELTGTLKKEMCEYEILKESIGKCTDEGQMERATIEAELVILTKSGVGNIRKYTFMKC